MRDWVFKESLNPEKYILQTFKQSWGAALTGVNLHNFLTKAS